MGAELIIDRAAEDYRFWRDGHTQDPKEWKRLGSRIRDLTGGEDVDIVFEHPGRETFGASVYVTRRGGTIVTCASTSGFLHEYDNRYLWMSLKRIIGSHFANYREAWQANRLIAKGMIHPPCRRCTRWRRPGRPRWTCTGTCTTARSRCLCLSPHEAWACGILSCAPGTSPKSTGSGTCEDEAGMTEPYAPPHRPARERPWLMRTYAGHSSAAASNALFRRNLAKGQTGLSVAFDLPTQTGYDADHVLAAVRSAGSGSRSGTPVTCGRCSRASRWSGPTPR